MNKEDVKNAFMNHSYNKMKKANEQGLYVNTSDIPAHYQANYMGSMRQITDQKHGDRLPMNGSWSN